jgi:hypothetical protein
LLKSRLLKSRQSRMGLSEARMDDIAVPVCIAVPARLSRFGLIASQNHSLVRTSP